MTIGGRVPGRRETRGSRAIRAPSSQRSEKLTEGALIGRLTSGSFVWTASVCVEPDKDLEEALRLMAPHQVRRLPVVENGRLIGIVAQADIALKENEKTAELVKAISEPSEGERR